MKTFDKNRLINSLCIIIAIFWALESGQVLAFGPDSHTFGHTMITNAALGTGYRFNGNATVQEAFWEYETLSGNSIRFSQIALKDVVQGAQSRDWSDSLDSVQPGVDNCDGDDLSHAKLRLVDGIRFSCDFGDRGGHFDSDRFNESVSDIHNYIYGSTSISNNPGETEPDKSLVTLLKEAIQLPIGVDRDKKIAIARIRLGKAIHTLQDFYAHSNWVETGHEEINYDLTDQNWHQLVTDPNKYAVYPKPGLSNEYLQLTAGKDELCIARSEPELVVDSSWEMNGGNYFFTPQPKSQQRRITSASWESDLDAVTSGDYSNDEEGHTRCDHGAGKKGQEVSGIAKDAPHMPYNPSPNGEIVEDKYYTSIQLAFNSSTNEHKNASYLAFLHTKALLDLMVNKITAEGGYGTARTEEMVRALLGEDAQLVLFVVDNTGSMAGYENEYLNDIADYIDKSAPGDDKHHYALSFFGEPNANYGSKEDVVNSIRRYEPGIFGPTGGRICGDLNLATLQNLIPKLPIGSKIIFFTDSQPPSVDNVVLLAKIHGISISGFVTGTCNANGIYDDAGHYKQLAYQTGGKILPVDRFNQPINLIMGQQVANKSRLANAQANLFATQLAYYEHSSLSGVRTIALPVESGVEMLTVTLMSAAANMQLFDPNGVEVTQGEVAFMNGRMLNINSPNLGNWTVTINGNVGDDYTLVAEVVGAIQYRDMELKSVLSVGRPGHEYHADVTNQPQSGRLFANLQMNGTITGNVELEILNDNGDRLGIYPLNQVVSGTFEGEIVLPEAQYRVHIKGLDENNKPFSRMVPVQFDVPTPASEGNLLVDLVPPKWQAGDNPATLILKNFGGDEVIGLSALLSGSPVSITPSSINLPNMQETTTTLDIVLPSNFGANPLELVLTVNSKKGTQELRYPVQLELPQVLLTVTRIGSGTGAISDGNGVNCGEDCSEFYEVGSTVTLVATPTEGDTFVGWSGNGCAGTNPICLLTIQADSQPAITATFNAPDNGVPGITVNPTTGLITTEAGGTAVFTVVLDTEPAADVTIALSSSNLAEGTVNPVSLTFTAANFATPQTVTVTGVDDATDDGDVGYSIVTAAATSADANYNGREVADVAITNTDNDVADIVVTPTTGLSTTEAGDTAAFTVAITSQPTADVTIALSSSDTTEGTVNPTTLTFTTANFATAQTVTVMGVDDFVVDGSVDYTIATAAASSADGNYNGKNPSDVTVSNSDNDVDSDGDGVIDALEGNGDRDGDGIANAQDYDPTGYFYDEATGQIIAGGRIFVACDVGTPQFVNNLNGNNGYYQFVVSAVGTPSTCAITLAIPEGYTLSNQCLSGGTLDVSAGPNPQVLGSNENGASGVLANRTCAANPFFLNLVINPGDAAVLNNNIPLAAIQPILPIPTLSQWALGLLALTLFMSGFYWQRRFS